MLRQFFDPCEGEQALVNYLFQIKHGHHHGTQTVSGNVLCVLDFFAVLRYDLSNIIKKVEEAFPFSLDSVVHYPVASNCR